jgi:protein dithiol:quinone oxidoreductase
MALCVNAAEDAMFETRNPIAERRSAQQSLVLGIASAASIGAVLIAVYLQDAWQLYPCPLCILQRYAFLAVAMAGALALLVKRGWLRDGLTGLTLAFSLAGLAVVGRHIWLILNPAEGCGRDRVAEFVNSLPMAQWLPGLFNATGNCIDEIPPVLGISFPVWALILFTLLVAALTTVLVRGARV